MVDGVLTSLGRRDRPHSGPSSLQWGRESIEPGNGLGMSLVFRHALQFNPTR